MALHYSKHDFRKRHNVVVVVVEEQPRLKTEEPFSNVLWTYGKFTLGRLHRKSMRTHGDDYSMFKRKRSEA